jgi:hypothetical protein
MWHTQILLIQLGFWNRVIEETRTERSQSAYKLRSIETIKTDLATYPGRRTKTLRSQEEACRHSCSDFSRNRISCSVYRFYTLPHISDDKSIGNRTWNIRNKSRLFVWYHYRLIQNSYRGNFASDILHPGKYKRILNQCVCSMRARYGAIDTWGK